MKRRAICLFCSDIAISFYAYIDTKWDRTHASSGVSSIPNVCVVAPISIGESNVSRYAMFSLTTGDSFADNHVAYERRRDQAAAMT
jgi:hypothetical protein